MTTAAQFIAAITALLAAIPPAVALLSRSARPHQVINADQPGRLINDGRPSGSSGCPGN